MTNPYKHKSISLTLKDIQTIKELSGRVIPGQQLSNAQTVRLGIRALKENYSPGSNEKENSKNDRAILDTREKN